MHCVVKCIWRTLQYQVVVQRQLQAPGSPRAHYFCSWHVGRKVSYSTPILRWVSPVHSCIATHIHKSSLDILLVLVTRYPRINLGSSETYPDFQWYFIHHLQLNLSNCEVVGTPSEVDELPLPVDNVCSWNPLYFFFFFAIFPSPQISLLRTFTLQWLSMTSPWYQPSSGAKAVGTSTTSMDK